MKPAAIFYALSENHLAVLDNYLRLQPSTVLVPDDLLTTSLRAVINAAQCECVPIITHAGTAKTTESTPDLLSALAQTSSLLEEPFGSWLQQEVSKIWPHAVRAWESLMQQTKAFQITLAIMPEAVTSDYQLWALWAKQQAIPVLQLPHSAVTLPTHYASLPIVDHVAVANERLRERYLERGIPAERIHLTGCPQWDGLPLLLQQRPIWRQQLAKACEWDADTFWILWEGCHPDPVSVVDQHNEIERISQAFAVLQGLQQAGLSQVRLIYKANPAANTSIEATQQTYLAMAQALHLEDSVRFIEDEALVWVVAADLVVSHDFDLPLTALLADVPAIHVLSTLNVLQTDCFGADEGIITVEPTELTSTLQVLCSNSRLRQDILAVAATRKPHIHYAHGKGLAAERVARLMRQLAKPITMAESPVWQRYLQIETGDLAQGYHTTGRQDLIAMFSNCPTRFLDVGCAGGANGVLVKQRFPGCEVWGIEANQGAATMATNHIDKVLTGFFEDVDLAAEGWEKGSLDGVLLADVLEHMYNPWQVMVTLREYLSEQGQIVISVPNVRNLWLINELIKGNWRYEKEGLLDITHIRFFSLKELTRFCHETGFKIVRQSGSQDGRCLQAWSQAQDKLPGNIETDQFVIKNVTYEEMLEMSYLQFYLLLEKVD